MCTPKNRSSANPWQLVAICTFRLPQSRESVPNSDRTTVRILFNICLKNPSYKTHANPHHSVAEFEITARGKFNMLEVSSSVGRTHFIYVKSTHKVILKFSAPSFWLSRKSQSRITGLLLSRLKAPPLGNTITPIGAFCWSLKIRRSGVTCERRCVFRVLGKRTRPNRLTLQSSHWLRPSQHKNWGATHLHLWTPCSVSRQASSRPREESFAWLKWFFPLEGFTLIMSSLLFWLNLPNCTIYSIWTSKKGQRWRKRCKNRPRMNWVIQVVVIVIDGRRVHIFLLDLWYFAVWFQCPIQFQVQAYHQLLMRESLEIW